MIKLLSVLLLMAIMLTGCNNIAPAETTAPVETTAPEATEEVLINKEEPHESVEQKLENFIKPSEDDGIADLENVTRLEGTIVSSTIDGRVLAFRTADVDAFGTVTETINVYNASAKKTVLTVSNTYKLGDYDTFDWYNTEIYDETIKLPSSLMKVTVKELGISSDAPVIVGVSRATVTEIPEETREKNENGCVFNVDLSYTYYDALGNEITKSKRNMIQEDPNMVNAYIIGTAHVVFDGDKAVKVVNGETEKVMAGFDYENDKYGYYYNSYSGVYRYIEVYSKNSGNCVLRYHLEPVAPGIGGQTINVLEDGDIFIQDIRSLPEDSNKEADVVFYDGQGASGLLVNQYILDVETGKTQALDLGFIVQELIPNRDLDEAHYIIGFEFTEHTVNLAAVVYIENKKPAKSGFVVLDNDMSVMFETNIIIPEHNMFNTPDALGIEILANGDYLVSLYDVVTSRAIVTKDGKIRAYLPDNANIAGSYIVNEYGIYTYDMELIYDFEEEGYEFGCVFADNIIVYKEEADIDDPTVFDDVYYELSVSGTTVSANLIFEDETIYSVGDDYIITSGDKYVLYNAKLDHVLTTENSMQVYEFDGNFYVFTSLAGHNLFYAID